MGPYTYKDIRVIIAKICFFNVDGANDRDFQSIFVNIEGKSYLQQTLGE